MNEGNNDREALKAAITDGYWQRTGYRVSWQHIGPLMDAILAAGFARHPQDVTTEAELMALPHKSIVMSAVGTVACRFDDDLFVCFGDDRPGAPWSRLALPAQILWLPVVPETTETPA